MLWRDQKIELGEIDMVPLDEDTELWHNHNSKARESKGAEEAEEPGVVPG